MYARIHKEHLHISINQTKIKTIAFKHVYTHIVYSMESRTKIILHRITYIQVMNTVPQVPTSTNKYEQV
jgi:hypothetical protein